MSGASAQECFCTVAALPVRLEVLCEAFSSYTKEGLYVNVKVVERFYHEERLALRRRIRKKIPKGVREGAREGASC